MMVKVPVRMSVTCSRPTAVLLRDGLAVVLLPRQQCVGRAFIERHQSTRLAKNRRSSRLEQCQEHDGRDQGHPRRHRMNGVTGSLPCRAHRARLSKPVPDGLLNIPAPSCGEGVQEKDRRRRFLRRTAEPASCLLSRCVPNGVSGRRDQKGPVRWTSRKSVPCSSSCRSSRCKARSVASS